MVVQRIKRKKTIRIDYLQSNCYANHYKE